MATKMISYVAYVGQPERFVQFACDPLPSWAVDVREHTDTRTLTDMYRKRGLTDSMIERVYSLAYERGHSAGKDEVNTIFRELMFNLFKLSYNNNDKADFG